MSLTEEEIKSWGNKTELWLTFYEFTNVYMTFVFNKQCKTKISKNDVVEYFFSNSGKIYELYETLSEHIKDTITDQKQILKATIVPNKIKIKGILPERINFNAIARYREMHLNIPSVVVYDNPSVKALERNVYIEAVECGEFELIQSKNYVAVCLDLTPISVPSNCIFQKVQFNFKRQVKLKSFSVLGLPELEIPVEYLMLNIGFI